LTEPETAGKPEAPPAQDEGDEKVRLLAALQRAQADFQNYRARMERERAQWRDDMTGEAVLPFLSAFDNLGRALEAAKAGGTLEALVQGVTQVGAQVEKGLGSLGIRRVEAEGKPLDPKLHEVIAQVTAPAGVPAGQVVQVVEQGYTLGGRLLKPARVTVAAGEKSGGA
jgi:molecular chaperone GrpE